MEVMGCNNKDEEIVTLIENYFNKNNIGNEVFLEIGEEEYE